MAACGFLSAKHPEQNHIFGITVLLKKKKKKKVAYGIHGIEAEPVPAWNEVKVSQSCLTLWDPKDCNSPWNSPSQNTGVGSLSLL